MRIEWRMSEPVPGHLVRLVETRHARHVARVTTLCHVTCDNALISRVDKWLSIHELCI